MSAAEEKRRGKQSGVRHWARLAVCYSFDRDEYGCKYPSVVGMHVLMAAEYLGRRGEALRRQVLARIHDIFGNPFHPITFLAEWRTSTVTTLAQTMYDSRDFSAMPILADALMDAGCDNDEILQHCRGPGPHVRGCWVGDECLSKS